MTQYSRPKPHNFSNNPRPAIYLRTTEAMLNELRRLRAEMNVPVRVLVLNALLCTYPHLATYCEYDSNTVDRYFARADNREKSAGPVQNETDKIHAQWLLETNAAGHAFFICSACGFAQPAAGSPLVMPVELKCPGCGSLMPAGLINSVSAAVTAAAAAAGKAAIA